MGPDKLCSITAQCNDEYKPKKYLSIQQAQNGFIITNNAINPSYIGNGSYIATDVEEVKNIVDSLLK